MAAAALSDRMKMESRVESFAYTLPRLLLQRLGNLQHVRLVHALAPSWSRVPCASLSAVLAAAAAWSPLAKGVDLRVQHLRDQVGDLGVVARAP